ncbi:hypothetical protein [Macrococcoides caseolyticum]|uniref:hypothetical protein n=1 Tax=Macrococcoides caseolyticum TaxID=69966 RepID=UPI003F607A0D
MNKAYYTDILDLQDAIEDLRKEIEDVESTANDIDRSVSSIKFDNIDVIRRIEQLEKTVLLLSEQAQLIGPAMEDIVNILKKELNIDIEIV